MSVFSPSRNVADLRESATIAVSTRARMLKAAGRRVIDLGAGEPDFPTPAFVVDAAHRALDAGATRYTSVDGILPLRQAIAERASAVGGPAIDASDVVVTAGTKQALFNACFTVFSAGDEVLVPTPGWTSYYEMLGLARATAVPVCGARERQLKVTPDDLRAAATSRTRGLILNSPCNPTGAVYSRAELEALTALASDNGWWIVSDEIYRQISYDAEAASLLSIAAGHAALAALTEPEAAASAVQSMVGELRLRRDEALAMLHADRLDVIDPEGAFYLFIRVVDASPADPEPGTSFARRPLEEYEVAVVPGAAFRGAPEWIRVSYAAPAEQVREGVRRITRARIS